MEASFKKKNEAITVVLLLRHIDPMDRRSGGGQNGKIPLLIKGGRDALYSMR